MSTNDASARVLETWRALNRGRSQTDQVTVQIYIGADNATGQLDLDRIKSTLGKRHDAFTVWIATGAWRGTEEPTAIVLLSAIPQTVLGTLRDLQRELRQEAIAWQEVPALQLVA